MSRAGGAVVRWLARAEALLGAAAPRLDALNLFPVPDADTGTNMHATLLVALRAVEAEAPGADLGETVARAGTAALDAARGNSGTLLAVALTGAAEPLRGVAQADPATLARALRGADRAARAALSDPREGTILSVLSAAADSLEASASAPGGGADPAERRAAAVTAMVRDARRAVEETESRLAPLTQARVVDAGAVGALWALEALRADVVGGGADLDVAAALHGYADGPGAADAQAPAPTAEPEGAAVEVMCTLELAPLQAALLRQRLEEVGDSVILAPVTRTADDAGRLPWRVHVHVRRAEDALAVLHADAEPRGVTVADLRAGHAHPQRTGGEPPCGEGPGSPERHAG